MMNKIKSEPFAGDINVTRKFQPMQKRLRSGNGYKASEDKSCRE